ncbi:MAG: LacI family DNA-binding transcriptional regulator [Micropruina sp.]|uniref:LacI family DNA-binding transcriptional regulator n=1 Tax=Micropruina sp. TaxID=2737536 RepID=UPI0039E4934B
MSVTLKDVAQIAGVSTASASRALRGFETVDPTIRERVLNAAQRLGYVGSHAAAALATGRAGSVAIITPFLDRLAFQRMLSGVHRVLQGARVDMLVHCTGDPSDPHPVPPHRRLARRVDGFIVLSFTADSPDIADLLRLDVPVAMFGAHAYGTSSVHIDDRAGAASAVEHLLTGGHRRIGVIYGREADSTVVLESERHRGVRDAFGRAGLSLADDLVVPGDFTLAGGVRAMTLLMELAEPPTAVFAFSDEMAYGAIQALRAKGLQAGTDVALIGYDGHDLSAALDLSTVSVPFEEIGSTLARQLLARIQQPSLPDARELLPTQLVTRFSSRARSV